MPSGTVDLVGSIYSFGRLTRSQIWHHHYRQLCYSTIFQTVEGNRHRQWIRLIVLIFL